MNILDRTQEIRDMTKKFGRYRLVAEKSTVSYEWLCKFAVGKIINPTVDNVFKLEQFFLNNETNDLDAVCSDWYFENKMTIADRRSIEDRRNKQSSQ